VKYHAAETQCLQVQLLFLLLFCESDDLQLVPPKKKNPLKTLEILLHHLCRAGNYNPTYGDKPGYLMPLHILYLCVSQAVDNDQGDIPRKKLLRIDDNDNDNDNDRDDNGNGDSLSAGPSRNRKWKGMDKRSLTPEGDQFKLKDRDAGAFKRKQKKW